VDSLKLAGPTCICESACGKRRKITLRTLKLLNEAGRVREIVKRKRDGLVTRARLFAEPNEIASRITAQAEVVRIGASTWIHTRNLKLMGEARG